MPKSDKAFTKSFLLKPGRSASLSKRDPADTHGWKPGEEVDGILKENLARMRKLQYVLFAEHKRSLLMVIQAMDAGGKDGLIRHVTSSFNPQGCLVTSFKVPTVEEAEHDFLWRVHSHVPRLGEIAIFNRSHYEDVLVPRVRGLMPLRAWSRRYEEINAFEKYLAANGVIILKFFLHISKKEQKKRLQARLEDPERQWKFSPSDLEDRKRWPRYMKAYEEILKQCNATQAPWYVIPADKKWFRDLVVAGIIVERLEMLKMKFPKPTFDPAEYKIP